MSGSRSISQSSRREFPGSESFSRGGERPWARVGSPEGSTTCEVVSRLERMQFEYEGPQLARNSAMKYAKAVADSYRRAGSMSAITFVRAARFVTLLLVATLTIEFLVLAVVFSADTAVPIGFVLIPSLILATWIIAAVLGTVLLLSRWLWAKTQDQVLRAWRWTGAGSGVWDEWLDGSSRV